LLGGLAAAPSALPVFASGKDPKAEIIKQLLNPAKGAGTDPATGLKSSHRRFRPDLPQPQRARSVARPARLEVRKSFSNHLGGWSVRVDAKPAKPLIEGVVSSAAAGTLTEKCPFEENQELFNNITESIQGGLRKKASAAKRGSHRLQLGTRRARHFKTSALPRSCCPAPRPPRRMPRRRQNTVNSCRKRIVAAVFRMPEAPAFFAFAQIRAAGSI
jgi:hypothetical protein